MCRARYQKGPHASSTAWIVALTSAKLAVTGVCQGDLGVIEANAFAHEGCPEWHHVACKTERVQVLFALWEQRVRCWLCENITSAISTEALLLLHDVMELDLPVTADSGVTRPWLQTCLPAYVLALLVSTRNRVLQPWRMYRFGLSILFQCNYDEGRFFEQYGVTPSQIVYVFDLIGQQRGGAGPQFRDLQALERDAAVGSGGPPSAWDAPLVVDVGMGLGADARYYLAQGFRVVAVEANPTAIETAVADDGTAGYLRSGQLSVLNVAIAGPDDDKSHVRFFELPKRPEQSKALEWLTQDGGVEVSVRTVQCADILRVHGEAVYMKVDIEFNTVDCLESLFRETVWAREGGRPFQPPRFLSLEVEATHLAEHFFPRLVELGYAYYKVCRQFIYSPGPCEMSSYNPDVLGCGSGPFGEAAVDYLAGPKWRLLQQMPLDIRFLKEFNDGFDWFDLHFKQPD
eukprot:TRINITY_DN58101_c0_g1_i1.p1 TRINITY_DN58101_c0_g1~~TRINITY_DN58101_c0_g1_i1.p1  ORF type:complete len:459 (-),score=56.14 TRINITY_DN58101_c0_g1_i1:39-1415(-)